MASRSHQYFSLRWNNYQNTMTSVFQQLREDLAFVDVTLSCEHGSLKAHKVVLSACSSYFQKLLLENPCKHPTIILPGDIIFTDLKTIIDFVYRGEIDVTESELQGLLRTAEQLKIKGLCETAENTDDLNDAATATITVSENIQQAVVGNIVNTTVAPGQASPNTQHQQQQQQQQIATNTAVLTHNIGNVTTANSQPIGSTVTNTVGQLVTAGPSSQQQIGRKSRVRKRSKSPDLQQQVLNTQQQVQQHPQTILIQNQNQAAIVSLQQTSSGNYIPVSGVQTVTTSAAAQQQTVIASDESDTDKPALSKICKTETASASPASSVSGVSGSNNAGSVTTVAAPGTAIVTQIVVARDGKDKNMTSLGMGMNGGILGVPMGFLDFAPEPPAPSATPVTVTEHVDLSCNPNTDTRDLSNPTEALDIDNHLAQHMIQRLDQSPMHAIHHQTGDESNSNLVQHIKSEVIDAKQQQQVQQQQHHQPQQHQLHAQQLTQTQAQQQQHQQQHQIHQQQTSHSHSTHTQQQAQSHQDISGATVMEIDPSQIKHEPGMIITPEIVNMMTTGHMDMYNSDTSEDSMMIANGSPNDQNEPHYTNLDQQHVDSKGQFNGPKTWTQDDMNSALDALKNQNMSLTKASVTYGIPSTTLWQRAHRMGIETPKKEGGTKSWNEDSLNNALEALRSGQISANKASKAFGIPSSTLYKIARREGIRLAAPFNAAPTTWTPEDLERALEAIRAGHTSVQKASAEFGIPTGTLYGRCKREGIELSRSNPTPWSEDAMNEALNSVRIGQMSINQAAIHYNLPYSSLYGRFKRGKYDVPNTSSTSINNTSGNTSGSIEIIEHSQENSQQFQYSPSPHQQPQHSGQTQSQTPHLTQHVVHIQQSQTHHQQQVHAQQQQHIQQQDVVTSSSQVAHSSAAAGQQQQIQQIYHHHSTPERS
ncbi:transcription factor GAGA isoform X2 [Anastrepha obliqua]|uniref:transcription factor GAGA isoform X2 n=1 Tax=Anastrepha obliqua TaxID=95512 RepID=UPI00240A4CA1|nr:transcription factor GAGA isoform X2 [Anastrepha obliqua]